MSIPENTQISYQIIAVDDDSQDSIDSYSITGGTDDALFSMSEEGVLAAQFLPNFEDPQDYNKDNRYLIEIFANSGGWDRGRGVVADFTVTVQDVDGEQPGPVTNLRVTKEDTSCVRIDWDLPAVNPGPPVDLYLYQAWAVESSDRSVVPVALTSNRYLEQCDLDPAANVRVIVRPSTAEGHGDSSQVDAYVDDCGADSGNACSLAVGESRAGRINLQPDQDWFQVSLEANTRYQIDARGWAWLERGGTLSDSSLSVIDSSGNPVSGGADNDGGAGNNARLFFTPTASGTYYLQVGENGDDDTGTYTVSVLSISDNLGPKIYFGDRAFSVGEADTLEQQVYADDYDPSDSVSRYELRGDDSEYFSISNTGYLITASCTNFEVPDDADEDNVYEFQVWVFSGAGARELSASINVTVTITDGEFEVPGPPTNVRITDEGANFIRFVWDAPTMNEGSSVSGYIQHYYQEGQGLVLYGTGNNPDRFVKLRGLTPDTPANVRVRAANADGYGCHSAWIEGRTDDCGEELSDTCTITSGESREGRINLNRERDRDWFQIDMGAGTLYRIDVKGSASADPGGTLRNPRVRMLDANGRKVAGEYNDNGGAGKNARLDFTPDTTGVYHVRVDSKNSAGVGTYTVSVADLTANP